jgi:hypothetical protein
VAFRASLFHSSNIPGDVFGRQRTGLAGPLALTGLIRASKLVVSKQDDEPT